MDTPPETLAITICATKDYQYAMTAQARIVHANIRHLAGQVRVILVGDDGLKDIEKLYQNLFEGRDNLKVIRIAGFEQSKGQNYKNAVQLTIAQMRTAAFTKARSIGADFCWSVDSDVLPKSADTYRTLRWLLDLPNNFYEVAISPYPSQGGGDLLAGRGTPEHTIADDFSPEERIIPEDLQKRVAANKAALEAIKPPAIPTKELIEEMQAVAKAIGECSPKGNVFDMNAKNGWRRRGWLSNSWPGLGRGVFVQSDWCGFGSTLMSRRALDHADFIGYDGGGTEDLHVVWSHWHQVGIRIGAALHEPSNHVSRRSDGKYFLSYVRFVTDSDESKGECVGHLRIEQRPFYAQDPKEQYDPANDGIPIEPAKRTTTPEGGQIPKPAAAEIPPQTKAPTAMAG